MQSVLDVLTGKHGLQPSNEYVHLFTAGLAVAGTVLMLIFKGLPVKIVIDWFKEIGIKSGKIKRTISEVERKTFHLTGLGVPLAYQILTTKMGWTREDFVLFCWIATLGIWVGDVFRVLVPSSCNYFPYTVMNKIIREKEKTQLSGTCYFSLGVTVVIAYFPQPVAITSIIWLVIGDMCAAIIGISFGGDACVVKLGREGKKSLEGSAAMFISCVTVGLIAFAGVPLSDYAVIIGSLAATIVELYEPLGVNDNITIPICSAAALQWALARVENC